MEADRLVAPLLRGAIIDGRYLIQEFVGQGGMSRVYRAEDMLTQEPVAVKILHRERATDELACDRFLREVEVAATIVHPNVIRVLDAGDGDDGVPFLVLEFLFGESLGDLLRRDGVVDPLFVLSLLKKAALGLAAAHGAGIIHRDVKPDNLFLVGERDHAHELKVMDFGMAKLLEGESTAAGMALGTLEYMAPEQAIADAVDARTDVYGLGVVLYKLVTGRVPFIVADTALMIAKHLFLPPPRPTTLVTDLDPCLEAVILKALRKNPNNRYATMDEMREDLERLLGERSGQLIASSLAPLEEDTFQPTNLLSRTAASALRRRLEEEEAAQQ